MHDIRINQLTAFWYMEVFGNKDIQNFKYSSNSYIYTAVFRRNIDPEYLLDISKICIHQRHAQLVSDIYNVSTVIYSIKTCLLQTITSMTLHIVGPWTYQKHISFAFQASCYKKTVKCNYGEIVWSHYIQTVTHRETKLLWSLSLCCYFRS